MTTLRQLAKRPIDGKMVVSPLPYAGQAWDVLHSIALNHEEGYIRIAAAESMIRLADEFALPASAIYELPVQEDE